MKRRGSRKQSQTHFNAGGAGPTGCLALIWVDSTGIRKKILKDHQKVTRDLAKAKEQLDRFHQTDQPQFSRWMSGQFGGLLTELRELDQQVMRDESLVFLVETEVMMGGGSYVRAYQRVIHRRDHPEAYQSGPAHDGPGGPRSPFGSGAAPEEPENENDPLDEFFNDLFGKLGPDDGAQDSQDGWPGLLPGNPSAEIQATRLKELYRAVVRRLHPDGQRTVTAQQTEWWHQAQAAYEARNADRLELILTLCEIEDHGTTDHTSASLLQRITEQSKRSLRELKRQLSDLRCDVAWNFSRRTDHEAMAVLMRHDLTAAIRSTKARLKELEETLAEWKAKAERFSQPRSRKARQKAR